MIGKPKYKIGDIVRFDFDGIKEGVIGIIDPYGTFFDDSDASYDIMNKNENVFYKHIKENYIVEKIGEMAEKEIFN